ncbi:MAG TPA: cyclic beta 1-2 glucan synthetase, partial [Planctomycetota bacterium]|nr:cyclic beta 1-2 glucan synthetase [Planctomycetota bacterium]
MALLRPAALAVAGPVTALWFLAPAAAWWLSRPIRPARPRLSGDDQAFLRTVARRTWRFFESFVGAEDHHLPPDNFQEDPPRGSAHRTSPTNIGLYLTSTLAAYDFGYCSAGDVAERLSLTLATLDQMQRHRGHFYNWYDTITLEPLRPMYVSTVDSGNLAGHLLTLASGLEEIEQLPILRPAIFSGLVDTLEVLAEISASSPAAARESARLRAGLRTIPTTLSASYRLLAQLSEGARELTRAAAGQGVSEAAWWANAFEAQVRRALEELAHMAPWVALPAPADARLDEALTLGETARLEQLMPSLEDEGLRAAVSLASERAATRIGELRLLAARCRELADLDYELLYD